MRDLQLCSGLASVSINVVELGHESDIGRLSPTFLLIHSSQFANSESLEKREGGFSFIELPLSVQINNLLVDFDRLLIEPMGLLLRLLRGSISGYVL